MDNIINGGWIVPKKDPKFWVARGWTTTRWDALLVKDFVNHEAADRVMNTRVDESD